MLPDISPLGVGAVSYWWVGVGAVSIIPPVEKNKNIRI